MNIFCISLNDTQITNTMLLDWITDRERNRGINHEHYWIIKTDTELYDPSNDRQIHLLSQLIWQCRMNGFTSLMIRRNENPPNKREESESSVLQSKDNMDDSSIPKEES